MNKKAEAFTLNEIIISIVIISIIAVLTIANFANSKTIEERRISALSKKFNAAIENAYLKIVYENTRNTNIQTLQTEDGTDGDSKTLKDYFVKYLEGESYPEEEPAETEENTDTEEPAEPEEDSGSSEETTKKSNCHELIIEADSPVAQYKEEAQCAMFSPDIIAGFFLNKECNQTILSDSYYIKADDPNENIKEINNACGYVIYGFKKSQGIFAKDIFVIPLGKTRAK